MYQTKRTVAEHAKRINELSAGEVYEQTVSDHAAEDRATLHANGIQTIPAEKDQRTGRDAVHARLTVQRDGRPRLFVVEGCTVDTDQELYAKKAPTSTLAEFDSYIYPPGKDGKADKEEPIKDNDHGMDAMRYAVMHLDSPNRSAGSAVMVGHAGTLSKAQTQTTGIERVWA